MTLEKAVAILNRERHISPIVAEWGTRGSGAIGCDVYGRETHNLYGCEAMAIAEQYERQAKPRKRDLAITVKFDRWAAIDAIYSPFAAVSVDTATLTPTAR